MYHFVKKVGQFSYYYYQPLNRWEGIKNYASIFNYSEILALQIRFHGDDYSYIKA